MSRFTLKSRRGFTLIEIMIVVLIIAVLLAIAIPNFMKARDTSRAKACVSNLRQIDTAKMQWAMDSIPPKIGTDTPGATDLYPTYVKVKPTCPAGGEYTINAVDTNPTCPNADKYLDSNGVSTHALPL
jgi:prepilin-type N-terminal cleavage/methylation domain-containing protein